MKAEAKWYLSKFSWGHSFLELNNELLEKYSACSSSKEILQVQDEYLRDAQAEKANRRDDFFPPTSSESSDTENDDVDNVADDEKHENADTKPKT